ncbi:MAG TPA: immune inhibitor A, partial [bacterium]|nr:immune inhibitor A [bacterium]
SLFLSQIFWGNFNGNSGDSGNTGNTGDSGNTGDTGDTGNSGTILVSEDFEDGGTNWTVAGVWQIGAPTNGPLAAVSGSNVAATNLTGNYTDSANDVLMLNTPITIPASGTHVVEFMAWVNIEGGGYSPFDYAEVLVKRDTDTWQAISGIYLTASTPSPLDALDNTRTKITKKLGISYYKFSGDLSSYKGKTVQIGFRFKSDPSDNLEGIYIDNVVVK